MRKTIFAAAAAVLAANAASAADFPRGSYSQRPVASPIYNWSGAYAGLNLGYQWGETTNNPTRPAGIAGGGQIGYNWQNGAFVFGGETDIQISGADDTFAPWKFANPWFGTLRGRAGYAYNNFLFYGTLGLAYGGVKGTLAGLDESKTHGGWTAGVGVEVGLNPAWSARVEYLYVDLSDRSYSITGVKNGVESNLLRFGINYHF
ncbi:MAG: porin family protein [Pseudolabrys sp.]|nr:porin family protein [Pseudolabrys sp.]MBV9262520.1 porin family protein [Pseudolabrys sp.]